MFASVSRISSKRILFLGFFCLLSFTMSLLPSDAVPVRASDWTQVGPGNMDTDSVMVSMIQYLLRAHGCFVIVDGEFGIRTQQQVRAFQRHNGLPLTGTVNGRTWERLIVPLHPGSHGDAVRAAQVALQEINDEKLPIDGSYGIRTEQAVKALQETDHLPADGKVGPETWLHLTDPVPD